MISKVAALSDRKSVMQTYSRSFCILTMVVSVWTGNIIAQSSPNRLDSRLRKAEAAAARLEHELEKLRNHSERDRFRAKERIDSLEEQVKVNDQHSKGLESKLGSEIEAFRVRSDSQFTTIGSSVSRSYAFMALGGVALAALSGLLFFIINRRLGSHRTAMEKKIKTTRQFFEEQNVRLDERLMELFDEKLSLGFNTEQSPIATGEPDHSLALKVADEIIRIEKNLAVMDSGIRGRKQLAASVERIRDNFAANGYEIVAMLNKPYDDGMKVIANFRPDDSLADGEQVITRIIKPQVDYQGTMIQAAQIEVSQG